MRKMILAAAAAVMAGLAGFAAPVLEARISAVAVECSSPRGWSAGARAELERHLALVGAMGASRPTVAALTIVLGEKAPGEGEPEAHTSYAKLVGDRLYLWGDDKNCPGTLFAVYGFLENILGVVWPMPGDANIVAPKTGVVRIPAGWSWKYRPPLKSGMMRGGGKVKKGSAIDQHAELAPNALRRTPDQIPAIIDKYRKEA